MTTRTSTLPPAARQRSMAPIVARHVEKAIIYFLLLFYILHLYRNAFRFLHMGYASALAWALFLYILLLTLVVLRSSSVWVFYSGEIKGRAR